jgi:mannose-6-phosphate isomerase
VLDAAPGAVIYRGLRPGTTPDAIRAALAGGTFRDLLRAQPVHAGDCVALESGLCHALGAGVVVAEVQTPSDTTFRLYDWDRHDPARPLHVDAALECILLGEAERAALVPVRRLAADTPWTDGLRAAALCRTDRFAIEAIHASPSGDAEPFPVVTDGRPVVGIVCRGEATLRTVDHPEQSLRAGDTVLFPADLVPTTWMPEPDCLLLHATLPHPADRIRDGLPHGQRLA